ncbi:TnsA endonuclease C-terminal domain-containing protein [Marinomonas foliarum]|uniref:TnsA endonuclease C-terminal domain-containing protein n=1 Tax=Marinomonas foliarum TaxID=491950 RepID=UPI000DF36982
MSLVIHWFSLTVPCLFIITNEATTILTQGDSLKAIDVCMSLDNAYGLKSGESLFQLKRLLAHRYFHFDISIPFLNLRFSDLFAENIVKLQERLNVSG